MKNILLPTDFSWNSHNAISYALNFYKNETCNFILLHAFQVNGYRENSHFLPVPCEADIAMIKNNVDKNLNVLIQEIKMRYPDPHHTYTALSKNKELIDSINEVVRSSAIEVIIIGTQGNTDSFEVSYGSNTINILENVTNCPVLAIPSHVKFAEIKEVVFASDFKSTPKSEDFFFIKKILFKTKSQLRVLHIGENGDLSDNQKNNLKTLETILKDVPHHFHSLAHVPVPIGIYCFTESRGSDMITFINKKHNFLQQVLYNPLYKDLGNYSKIPVLIIQTEPICKKKPCGWKTDVTYFPNLN